MVVNGGSKQRSWRGKLKMQHPMNFENKAQIKDVKGPKFEGESLE